MTEQEYWDKAAESNNLRNDWICDKNVSDKQCLDLILPYLKPGTILDLGCGIGRLTQGYGTDISPKMLEIAMKLHPDNEYVLGDGHNLPYPDETFDNIFSMAMFQHTPNKTKQTYIKEVYRVLKPGGVFRVQFVTSGDIAPFSKPVIPYRMTSWVIDTGFELGNCQEGLIYPEWDWMTLIK